MILKDIFAKPVDRPIEGVIKADDEASLRLEMEEYVLTNEIEKRLESFLDAYNNYENANGVWVSGFFGSGKSHLLKMLALLMENRDLGGASALDLFLPKCGDNAMLSGSLKKAVSIPSKSILFNIDQKADVISKTQVDALLAVFAKVFDEMCGYYGKQGHIAQFERDLDARGLYGKFKEAFKGVSKLSWEEGREQALLEKNNIAKAYAMAAGEDESAAAGIIEKYRNQYKVSIEDFAEQVQAYIETQVPNFRLNFFVDEVGQYIAENTKLMTNLQTIAESLATKCRGRAWVIVTAQEDMGKVLGDMNAKQAHDFSKIQARFANRMKLTSQDVDEVIQKRLLQKDEEGERLLADMYQARSNSFKTLFDFADGSHNYKNFRDKEHFIYSYPFIPYQFALFQSAIQGLSNHNAFEGKHSSVGERSMLGVFQQVAVQISNLPLGSLATFDLMFEGIRTALKSQIQKAILQAEDSPVSPFAVKLLKALFLVKYVKEFKPTVRNLCVLMLDSFDQDVPQLKKDIEEALVQLEQQTYIQRNGDIYEYLTDEEKDVEEEIKSTEVESTDVLAELETLIFDRTLKERKIRYENGQDYPFAKKLDDRVYGRDQELSINVITPFNDNVSNEAVLQMQNTGRSELLVIFPPDNRLMRDLVRYKQTEKYIRQNTSLTQQESIKRILADKVVQNQERQANLLQQVQAFLAKASLFAMGSPLDIGGDNAQARIIKGFQELITRVYPNLRMLRDIAYSENDIGKYLRLAEQGTLDDGLAPLSEAETEMLSFIQGNNRGGVRTTIKSLLEQFQRKPYGWYYAAVLCILAKLCARGKVEIRKDGDVLEDADLERAIRNSAAHGNLMLEPQVEFTASQVKRLKSLYEEFFDAPGAASEAKTLARDTGNALRDMAREMDTLLARSGEFPFLNLLREPLQNIKASLGKPYPWYVTEFVRQEDALLAMREDLLDPIRAFMSGSQKDIYREARGYLQEQKANFSYIEDDEAVSIAAILDAPDCFRGNTIQQLKGLLEALQGKIDAQCIKERDAAKKRSDERLELLIGMAEFASVAQNVQETLVAGFTRFAKEIELEKLIPVIQNGIRRFEESEYPRIIAQVCAAADAAVKTAAGALVPPDGQGEPSAPSADSSSASPQGKPSQAGKVQEAPQPAPKVEIVSIRSVKVPFDKPLLTSEADLDTYLDSTRKTLLEEIRKGKRIQI
ncbi:MAG: BREX system P-loop protein BrxC [Desulfovibrio sp.]|jgi:hypothetical protein|nr:BREX system P-loop protein BrxC [Desulfovibrio sp.]